MKRSILLAMLAVFISGNIHSQEMAPATILLNYTTLEKKAERSDDAIANEKKGARAKTWISRGRLFQDIDNLGLEQVQLGIDKTILRQNYPEPLSSEKNADHVETLTYEHIQYFFENNRLRGWKRIDPIVEKPLDEAFRSYKKGIELTDADKKMKLEEKIKPDLDELKAQFQREGQDQYYLKNYKDALLAFESILQVNKIEIYDGLIDTLMINYCGIVAREIAGNLLEEDKNEEAEKMYRKTIDYYNRLADLGFGGSSAYVQMTRDFYAIGDTLGAIENLKKGIRQYPDSSLLVTLVAQAYYLMKDNETGLSFVNQRIKDKPDGPAAYYWKGLLITNQEDVDEETIKQALAYYDTSLMYDPTNGSVWYQSGYVNYAVGANYFEQESYEENPDLRKELNAEGVKYYEEAVEKLEKTYEISGDDHVIRKESLDLLKRIYYKLYGGEDDRYLDVNKRLNNL